MKEEVKQYNKMDDGSYVFNVNQHRPQVHQLRLEHTYRDTRDQNIHSRHGPASMTCISREPFSNFKRDYICT